MLSLNNIKRSSGATHKKKRVGRGNASGHGTYSTRGLKGQKARSGVSGLKRLGMRKQLLQTPKLRGFRSLQPKNQIVSVALINKNFHDGDVITPESLWQAGLIKNVSSPVKILGKEKLTIKVKFEKVAMSAGVKSQISA
ncbi:MAG TPA: 50S ribosomal protein L15 [bacterium]|jgi:large subunit ribosomal protein L15|nr:MAG: 50S ribosomal protein L15 [Parcubacteria group bacterium ADurb.Bin115]HNU81120.1 50S ribosomal protein L15 [bacterium]HOD86730.1 50S ribosomal protein L15 [bacterium]HPW05710.1 50S ribosomal protein L15 [bacterium]HPY99482.1 50S ribosomal protein L15 [bacterium]